LANGLLPLSYTTTGDVTLPDAFWPHVSILLCNIKSLAAV